MTSPKAPLRNLAPDRMTFVVLGVVLREMVALGLLTADSLNAISTRTEELLMALAKGKILDVTKDGLVTVRDVTPDEIEEMDARPDEFPIAKRAKKTLDL